MNQNDYFQVAAYQGEIIEKCPEKSLEKTLQIMEIVEKREIDILCMPESYLHGYLNSKKEALEFSLNLQSTEFAQLCEHFKGFSKTTLLLGINERDGDNVFNTVVIIEHGKYVGKYRKTYTYEPYNYFSLDRSFPVFEKKGVKYGIIICLDSTYREPAHITALCGAKILFCPCFNRVSKDDRMLHYLQRKSHLISRAFDNDCWLVASDIFWDKKDHQTCPGSACILSRNGDIVTEAQPFTENILSYAIPITDLKETKKTRLFGNPELSKIMQDTYKKIIEAPKT